MKIGIDLGHCIYGYDTSAIGIIKESDANRQIGACLIPKLKALGHTVVNCTIDSGCSSINDSLRKRVNIANNNNVDVFISIHLNAGGGQGVECYISCTGGRAETYANKIQNQLVNLGYTNRKVKLGNFYVIKNTNAPAVLIEAGFVDSRIDCNLFNADKIANAICIGLTGQGSNATGNTNNSNTSNNNSKPNDVTGSGVYEWEDMPSPNATIVNDFFYVRDEFGNQVNGRRVDIGDKVFIIDVGYSKQLVELFYPTSIQPIHAYIKNATNCISYMYQDQYKNGSTSEPVYETSDCSYKIGSLNPYETATPLYRKDGVLHVVYSTSKGKNTKSGFVKYNGSFSKF